MTHTKAANPSTQTLARMLVRVSSERARRGGLRTASGRGEAQTRDSADATWQSRPRPDRRAERLEAGRVRVQSHSQPPFAVRRPATSAETGSASRLSFFCFDLSTNIGPLEELLASIPTARRTSPLYGKLQPVRLSETTKSGDWNRPPVSRAREGGAQARQPRPHSGALTVRATR